MIQVRKPIKVGAKYRRKKGNRDIVKVIKNSSDGFVTIQDSDGRHYLREEIIQDYFEEIEDDKISA